jgi:hypothetical protein
VIFLVYAIITWFLGIFLIDWNRWRLGYPTVLFASLCSFFLDTSLTGGFWSYSDSLLHGLWPNILLNLSLYPVGTWIFLQRFPENPKYKVGWVLLGVFILLAEEIILRITGQIHYHNGWNLAFSALANFVLLFLLKMHFNVVELRSTENGMEKKEYG